jgi:hypothetical protein
MTPIKQESELARLIGDPDLYARSEVREELRYIAVAAGLTSGQFESLSVAFKHGPVWAGDWPSKQDRDAMIEEGFLTPVVFKGEDGYTALNHRGYQLYKYAEAIRKDRLQR